MCGSRTNPRRRGRRVDAEQIIEKAARLKLKREGSRTSAKEKPPRAKKTGTEGKDGAIALT
jgi:hypothetical protein